MVKDLENEIWKPVRGFDGTVFASNLGRIKRPSTYWESGRQGCRKKHLPERLQTIRVLKDGYCKTTICYKGIKKSYSVHRLVAIAFLPNPENLPCVNHKNGNKQDNCIENLEWCTHKENNLHSVNVLGHRTDGIYSHQAKLRKEDVEYIRKYYIPNDKEFGRKSLAKKFGVDATVITNVITFRTYKNI